MTEDQINHTKDVCYEVTMQRVAQDKKWGQQNRRPGQYAIILHEEVGEVAKEICEIEFSEDENDRMLRYVYLRNELIDVAAVAVAMIESLDRNELKRR